MAESRTSEPTSLAPRTDDTGASRRGSTIRLVVWVLLSVAFIAFLLFGSVNARIWRFGRLRIESKSIAEIWKIQADNLPDLTSGWIMQVVFLGSMLVFVACVIIGMRYLLEQAASDSLPATTDRS
jgi:hypothetical protein